MYGMRGPPVPDNHIQTLPDNWFDQRVDHFNTSDTRTFKQRYFINNKYYKTGGPVFLLVDGENEGQDYFITAGALAGYAQRFGALAVDLEHRYYGQSLPTEDLSIGNLRYLTVGQALKDTEQFIGYLNRKLSLNNNTKWIAFGGSYAGNLVAFLREKYPHAVAGSVASSAPIQMTYDFNQYYPAVSQSLGTECSKQVREAFQLVVDQLKTPDGWLAIGKEFKLCTPLNGTDRDSVYRFMLSLMEPFAISAQYDGRSPMGVHRVCSLMMTTDNRTDNGSKSSPVDRLAQVMTEYRKGNCIDYEYNKLINVLKDIKPSPQAMFRQWFYQMCTEFGYFQTTDHSDSPFGHNVPIDHYVKICSDAYGKQFTPDVIRKSVDRFNQYYGGAKPENITNVVFTNGAVDPWHVLSVLTDLNPTTRAIYMNSTSHGAEMLQPLPTDPQELTDARLAIEKQLQLFLQ
ncbi:putative serine protease K12H4.7 [Oppia nitens]|uniref:putative serine protease K12H4.7 n=1 Tax=Oppia nitens TaxID=1686743 RepID=UPI0023DBA6CA|nr:putative serine protease K12H4.7 [Oppia nitens]